MAVKKTTTQEKQQQSTASQSTTNQQNVTSATGTSTVTVPKWLQPFLKQDVSTGSGLYQQAAQEGAGFQVPPETLDALRKYASGAYVGAGPEMDAYVKAAMDAATPGIIGGFGGMGGNPLASLAARQQGVNSFATLFPQEQSFQLQAANALPGMEMLPIQLQMQLAQQGMNAPGQFAPLFGQNTSSNSISNLTGTTNTLGSMTGKTTGVTSEPLYQTPWWQTALGAVGAGAGLLGSMNPAIGAGKAIAGAGVPLVSSLVGSFRGG